MNHPTELACPNCGGPLDADAGSLTCEDCQEAAHQAAQDRAREPDRWPASRPAHRARTDRLDCGRYSLEVRTEADGSVSVAVVHISASQGSINGVCYLHGRADAAPGEPLLTVIDAYDATNYVRIAPGGGRP